MAEYSPSKIIKDGNTYNFRDTTKIPLAGSNQISGSLIPATTNAYDLGSSSYQWNNAYIKSLTINGVACGDILTHNVSEFVDVTSAQTIGGVKTFSSGGCTFWKQIKINHNLQYGKNNPPSQSAYHNLMFTSANDWWGGYIENVTDTSGNSTLALYVRNTNEIQSRVYLKCDINGSFSMYPLAHNVWDLGTSTNKWKSLNGINPGALSLPSMSFISLDTTGFDLTNTTIGTFTSTIDGWAILSMSQRNKPFGIWILNGGYRVTFQSVHHGDEYLIFALIPVRANVSMNVYCTADDIDSTRKIDWLRVFPCQGNV